MAARLIVICLSAWLAGCAGVEHTPPPSAMDALIHHFQRQRVFETRRCAAIGIAGNTASLAHCVSERMARHRTALIEALAAWTAARVPSTPSVIPCWDGRGPRVTVCHDI